MKIKNEWIEAIDKRKSRRTYIQNEIDKNTISKLTKLIGNINQHTKLNIQLIQNGSESISGFKASYGMITGVDSFIALVGNENIENFKQKLGYYGEMIVLEATSLGLSTCWVGGTYDKESSKEHIQFNEGEELVCIIVVGYSPEDLSIKEKVVKNLSKKNKVVSDLLITNNKDVNEWINKGIEFALKAPSALNKKEVIYSILNNKIKVDITKVNYGYEEIDLGISMLHFEIGAYSQGNNGSWHYENGEYTFS